MRVLAFGDIHDEDPYYKSIEQKIKEFKPELVIGVGDIVNYKKLFEHFTKSESRFEFVFIHGNNDNLEEILARLRNQKSTHYLDFREKTIKNVKFLGIGGVLGIKKRNFNLKKLNSILESVSEVDILITHIDPESKGGNLIKEFIREKQPRYWFHGHKHECAGRIKKIGKTFVINASRPVITDIEF